MTTKLPQTSIAPLTDGKLTAIQRWQQQPEQSYAAIRTATVQAMIEADTPNLWEIRSNTDHATAIGIIVLALIHTARLVNIENNLNEAQIGEIANDVIEDYGYLKVEELKHILKTNVRNQKLFGRLDYNVVMNWFEEYDRERTEQAMIVSHNKEIEERKVEAQVSASAVSWAEYVERIKGLAEQGNAEAIEKLQQINDTTQSRFKLTTAEDEHRKECEFKKFYYDYLKQQK